MSESNENLPDDSEMTKATPKKKTATKGQVDACEKAREAKRKKMMIKNEFNVQLTKNLEGLYSQLTHVTENVNMVNNNVNSLLKAINNLNQSTNWVPFEKKSLKRKAEAVEDDEEPELAKNNAPVNDNPSLLKPNSSIIPNIDSNGFLLFLCKALGVAASLGSLYVYKQSSSKNKHPSDYLYVDID